MDKSKPVHAPDIHFRHLPRRRHTFSGLVLVLVAALLLLWWKHQSWLGHPNAYMFGGGGDGFKNYMTTNWHLAHDSSYVHYDGMNYPYGEHVLFTDNQPLFSAGLQWWSRHISDLSTQGSGALNVFLFVSLAFGAGILYLLLRKLHLPVWYAGLAALGILFLSPQYNRFDGHFALSHTWVFPLLLFLLCRYEERTSRRYQSLLIGIAIWLAAQLHFYYFGLAALFLGLYTFYQIVIHPTPRNIQARLSHLVVMVILPFVLLNIWVHWSDYSPDRPSSPYGFSHYRAYWEGVFLPYESFPLFRWIDQLVHIRRLDFEAQEYAGLIVLAFTLWALIRRFRLFPAAWNDMAYHRVHKNYFAGIFFAALLLLIFSCGFPFAIPGMAWIVDYFGPLKQFRGLGRFTWAYYYVVSILAFYLVWNYSLRQQGPRARWMRWVVALAPLVVLTYEAATFQHLKPLTLQPNVARKTLAAPTPEDWLNKVDFTPYQAILPLPYYHIGSENLWLDPTGSLFRKVQLAALFSGTPDMGVVMSRTALGETVKSAQFVLEPGQQPALLNDLPDNRPLALLMEPDGWGEAWQRYRHLTYPSKTVYQDGAVKVYALWPDSIRSEVRIHLRSVVNDMISRQLVRKGDWLTDNPAGTIIYQSFDSLPGADHVFQGQGAYSAPMRDTTWLWREHLPKGRYQLSLWIYGLEDMALTQEAKLIEHNLQDNRQIWFTHEGLRFNLKSIVNGWALFDLPFEVREDDSRINIFLHKPGVKLRFHLDEMLIRSQDMTVFRRVPGWIIRNGHWYTQE